MKRKSNVYGQIYLHIFEFFLRLFRAKFDFLILSWSCFVDMSVFVGKNSDVIIVILATWRWLRKVVQIVLFAFKTLHWKYLCIACCIINLRMWLFCIGHFLDDVATVNILCTYPEIGDANIKCAL